MESIVAHDRLFRFKSMRQGKIFVEETRDGLTRRLALYEIHVFKETVKQGLDELE